MEVSIVNLEKIYSSVYGDRLDAEFYLPDYLDVENKIENKEFLYLDDVTYKIDVGHVGSMVGRYAEKGVWLLQTQNVKECFLDEGKKIFIDKAFHVELTKSQVRQGNILIARSGSFGTASMYLDEEIINSSDIIIIDPIKTKINPFYLLAFLNCKYGNKQLIRFASGGLQGHVNLTILEKLKISVPVDKLQELIEITIKSSFVNIKNSKNRFKEAENILLSELGLTHWQPKHQLTFIKNYSDTQQAGRIDAEYYQPKYEEIEKAIKNYSGGYSVIGEEFNHNKSTFNTDDEKLYQYVEIGSVNVTSGEIIPNDVLGSELPANAKRALNKGDVIVSKVRTYRGAITIVDKNGYVGSGAFTILSACGKINKETLLAFLHSKPLLAWSLKPNTGTSYPVIVDDDILNLPIPILPEKMQTKIKQKVTESFNLRKQSKHLLESAKKAVEMAIEQDEQTAIKWLQKEMKTIGVTDADRL